MIIRGPKKTKETQEYEQQNIELREEIHQLHCSLWNRPNPDQEKISYYNALVNSYNEGLKIAEGQSGFALCLLDVKGNNVISSDGW